MAAEEEDTNSLQLTQQMTNSQSIHGGPPYPSPIPQSTPPSSYGPLRSPSPAAAAHFGGLPGSPYRMMHHSVFGTHASSASLPPASGYYPHPWSSTTLSSQRATTRDMLNCSSNTKRLVTLAPVWVSHQTKLLLADKAPVEPNLQTQKLTLQIHIYMQLTHFWFVR